MGTPLNIYFINFFWNPVLKRQREYIIYENFNCLPITIHEIQADVRRTDRRMDTVLVIGTVLSFGHGAQKKHLNYWRLSRVKHLKTVSIARIAAFYRRGMYFVCRDDTLKEHRVWGLPDDRSAEPSRFYRLWKRPLSNRISNCQKVTSVLLMGYQWNGVIGLQNAPVFCGAVVSLSSSWAS